VRYILLKDEDQHCHDPHRRYNSAAVFAGPTSFFTTSTTRPTITTTTKTITKIPSNIENRKMIVINHRHDILQEQ
jgi:hypothetical protein